MKTLLKFNVLIENFNTGKFEPYDIMPTLMQEWELVKERIEKYGEIKGSPYWFLPKTKEEFKTWVSSHLFYRFGFKCEYEILLVGWPCDKHKRKIDIYEQCEMNIDLITQIFYNNIKRYESN